IGAGATILAAGLGGFAVVHQIGRQARHAIDQSKLNERIRLKLSIYEGLAEICKRVTNGSVQLPSALYRVTMELRSARMFNDLGRPIPIPRARAIPLLDEVSELNDASIEFIRLIEKWEIIDPRLKIFQTAMNAAMHDVRVAFQRNYFNSIMPVLPVDLPQGGVIPWDPPNDAVIAKIEELRGDVESACSLASCVSDDFLREMQVVLVGDLFDGRPELRQPLDPRFRTVTLADHAELNTYYETETGWGKVKAQADEDAQAILAARTRAIHVAQAPGTEG
ncbi:MAG: hypothetical protein PSX79_13275, partial [bacterium]|nr:hypothetical protein [bacterium]